MELQAWIWHNTKQKWLGFFESEDERNYQEVGREGGKEGERERYGIFSHACYLQLLQSTVPV